MKATFKVTGMVLISVILLLLLAVLGFKGVDYVRHFAFYQTAEAGFSTPAIHEGLVPQGFTYHKESERFLASGYMDDGSPSRIYVIDKSGNSFYSALVTESGKDYTGHVGGISYYGDYLYIASSKRIDVFPLADILNPQRVKVARIGSFASKEATDVSASFCFIREKDGVPFLYFGCYHDENAYKTPEKLHMTTPAGDESRAVLLSYRLDATKEYGIDTASPTAVYSIPSYVQGATLTANGDLVLSTSHGLATSYLYVYDLEAAEASPQMGYGSTAFGVDIPLYHLDSAALKQSIAAPPMAEELVYLDGRIYIMCESASNKYLFGKITSGNRIWSVEIE